AGDARSSTSLGDKQSVGTSDSVLHACKSLLCFRHELPQDSTELLKTSGLLGVQYGVQEDGLLDGAFQLLYACSALAPSFVRRLEDVWAANVACWQLQSGGSNELSPDGVLAAVGLLSVYVQYSANLALDSEAAQTEFFEFVLREGVAGVLSLLLL